MVLIQGPLTSILGEFNFELVTFGVSMIVINVHSLPWKVLWAFTLETWRPKSPITNLTFGLQVGTQAWRSVSQSRRKEWFLRVGTAESWHESDATIEPLHFFRTLDPYSSITSLGPKLHFWPTPPFNFGVSLTLDPTIDPPYIYILHVSRINPTFPFLPLNTLYSRML